MVNMFSNGFSCFLGLRNLRFVSPYVGTQFKTRFRLFFCRCAESNLNVICLQTVISFCDAFALTHKFSKTGTNFWIRVKRTDRLNIKVSYRYQQEIKAFCT